MFARRKIAALTAEFIGTFLIATIVLAMATRTQFPFFAAVAVGSVVAFVILALGRFSGPHLNPAVTIGLWTLRKVQTMQALVYIVVQMLAGFVAFRVSEMLLDTSLQNVAGQNVDWSIITAEAIGTFVLGLAVGAAVHYAEEGAKLAGTVGLALMVGIMVASLGSNAVLNPAVALGINSFSVSYVVGPLIGAVLGMNLFAYLFAPLEKASSKKR